MVKRIITGIVLIACVVGLFFLRTIDTRFFNILTFACCLVGTLEMVRALGDRIKLVHKIVAIIFGVGFVPIYVFFGVKFAMVFAFAAVAMDIFTLVFEFETVTLEQVGLAILALIYPGILLLPILLANDLPNYSQIALLMMFVIAPSADTFAYFVGTIFKGPKLSPKISPKKTISGAIGGLIGGAVGAIVIWAIFAKGQITDFVFGEVLICVMMGLIGGAVSELGDLVEGAIKRKVGIKDMGKILPGHGGALDRIDAILINSMFIYLFFLFIV